MIVPGDAIVQEPIRLSAMPFSAPNVARGFDMIYRKMRCNVLLFIASALWMGCVPSTRSIEQRLEQELQEALGPADRYTVTIEGLQARSGEAERVTVMGERVRPQDAPVLDRIDLELHGVKYNRKDEKLERMDYARATARIKADDLAAFLTDHRSVREASVTLEQPDQATIRLRPDISGLALPRGVAVEATGQLVADDGNVNFIISSIEAVGANLGSRVAQRLSEAINPLVDLSDLPANLQVTEVHVEDGAVRIEATGGVSADL